MWELEPDLQAISEILGHSTIAVTRDIYTHMAEKRNRADIAVD